MINVVIPMAGRGSRFANAGYTRSKPFIDVGGKPMIRRVMENLSHRDARYILIAREQDLAEEAAAIAQIRDTFPVILLALTKDTDGAAITVLRAHEYINNEQQLLIANSDQLIDIGLGEFLDDCRTRSLDGSILTFSEPNRDPKWSYAKPNEAGLVIEVKEKDAISEFATVGLYLFREGRTFVNAALDMIVANDRVKNEFYTCPVFNYAIRNGKKSAYIT